ncbi:eukaryotic translation initiation factor 1A X-linked a [Lates japonicus]|uniref:Eukaryotic translation initiation factor 1A X-linked a n=1 Tax=Lates japonicus TaxID=270547 RepID=A0AAD3MGY4_LATJO|nr:eukaryotic translation initiation factor 1A X-linked a [Lates japonicus]
MFNDLPLKQEHQAFNPENRISDLAGERRIAEKVYHRAWQPLRKPTESLRQAETTSLVAPGETVELPFLQTAVVPSHRTLHASLTPDIILPDYQDNKADVILKYNADEARSLKAYGELPEHAKINETDTFGAGRPLMRSSSS